MLIFLCVGVLVASAWAAAINSSSSANSLNFLFPSNQSHEAKPFTISVNQKFIWETTQRARLYRPSIALQEPQQPNWDDGPPPAKINELAEYWAHSYDWFKIQDQINANFSHYTITVPSSDKYPHPLSLHFIHEHANGPPNAAIPLLILHGWPSTNLEWSKVIHPLANPSETNAPRFHVVAPDLPGFGFSPAATHAGLGPRAMGQAFDSLMHQLGYPTYALSSTDLGWEVAMWMVHDFPASVVAHATDFFMPPPNATDLARFAANQTTAEENDWILSLQAFQADNSGYSLVHGTRPLALALAMTDSPVGFAGWVLQLLGVASDGYNYTFEEIITMSITLWIQGTYGNLRTYKEFTKPGAMDFPTTSVPTGVSQWANPNGEYPNMKRFPIAPRDWIERTANVTYFSRHEFGGHFPAQSQPQLWLQDVRAFFSGLPDLSLGLTGDS
ncbi:Alpha/Beta hydrolase protein [Lasiosphaeria miniovina]|uniref:Alpha/Beta hydrolase protein n=1 Tax=Lasiosphaeria miniovina TaxID=1954250 RepID=A0AA40A0N6_9PEZI|nr:Alpha/Beta hydrolase protein [Lasiosphaeria miniovina]KAK0707110.1 Alpha/Beta hydrolase protein [Lasiosphaeria miniovina]